MKRPTYSVTLDGAPVAKAHAWNSALRAMSKAVRDTLAAGETAHETRKEIVHLDRWTTERGRFVWTVLPGGREVVVTIQRH